MEQVYAATSVIHIKNCKVKSYFFFQAQNLYKDKYTKFYIQP